LNQITDSILDRLGAVRYLDKNCITTTGLLNRYALNAEEFDDRHKKANSLFAED